VLNVAFGYKPLSAAPAGTQQKHTIFREYYRDHWPSAGGHLSPTGGP
jgi:hypothetical protein